jgi:hypothetical protein
MHMHVEHARPRRFNPIWIVVAVVSIVFFGSISDLPPPFALAAILAVVAGAVLTMLSPVGRALAHRLQQGEGGAGADPQLLAEVEDMRLRMAELEERLDFTERLLAQVRTDQPQRVGGGPA